MSTRRRAPASFAVRLIELREARGLDQRALAARSGMTVGALWKIERAGNSPRLSTLLRLARALEIEPCELLVGVRDAA